MEELYTRIKQLERRRIEYFLDAPDNSHEQYSRDIREGVTDLLQEIPLNITADAKQYLVGKILNILPDYEPKCEEQLEQSLRANSTRTDAWLELGQCVWKKRDLIKAHACFKEAVEREPCLPAPKAFCLLSAALRALSDRCADNGQRVQMLNEALRLCHEALRLRKTYPFAYYSLANTFLARFFALQQNREDDLTLALNAFASALKMPTMVKNAVVAPEDLNENKNDTTAAKRQLPRPFISPDLHLNYGIALYYAQFYAKALAQFRRALAIEPHFGQAKHQLDSARQFLCALRDGLNKKGNIARRRLRTLLDTFPLKAATLMAEQHFVMRMKPARTLAICSTLDDLIATSSTANYIGLSLSAVASAAPAIVASVTVRCVGVVSNEEKIPSVIICVDRSSVVVALSVYNCSAKFGALIGDTFTIIQPNLIRFRWKDLGLDDDDNDKKKKECSRSKDGGGGGAGVDKPAVVVVSVDDDDIEAKSAVAVAANKTAENHQKDDDDDAEQCLLMIRIINPSRQLLKNGKPLSSLDCAFAAMSIETQQMQMGNRPRAE
ncbi:hypothetical protein niasHT_024655 [Heterodera trifolii]|uniref:Tetratricopeptide repeat protein 5 OB fold domain-containing protein n=1 Tax=Heterodera trifolii TaxID=157864 RepID=A0ABD2K7M8_9BILA